MTMPFRPRNFRRRRFWYWSLGVVLFLFLVVMVARWGPHALATPAQAIARPLIAARDAASNVLTASLSFFESKASLQSENAELEQEVIFYKAAIAERDYFIGQTAQLQKLLGQVGSSSAPAFAVGTIMTKPGFSPYDTLIAAVGSGAGIKTGDLVFADPHTLIGFVSSVSAVATTITAYSTPGQNINVLIGSSSLETAAQGLGGGTLEVLLPHSSPVAVGDIVTAADIPGADILGQVEVATSTPTDPFERVLFTSPVDIFDLSYVLIKK